MARLVTLAVYLACLLLLFCLHAEGRNDSLFKKLHTRRTSLVPRDLQFISDEDQSNPIQAAKDVQALPYLAGNSSGVTDFASQLVQGDSDEGQLPWNNATVFIQTPNANLSNATGWIALPDLVGFDLNRTWQVLPNVTMPFYSLSGINPVDVKRALITWPGKPRDVWKYANLYRNALTVVQNNQTTGVTNGSVLIISPVWLNQYDQQAGASLPTELVFHGSQWEAGGTSRSPHLLHSMTTYHVMDNFTDMLFNKKLYPNLNQVVIAGHSMGGQAAHRYAILKKQKYYDDNMSYWVGNPGSWTYLTPNRPYHNATCNATYDNWHYGIGGNMTKVTKYARKDIFANTSVVVQRYLNRKVHMALGLLDNGKGDTHCEASNQGGNHLDRGSQYVLHLADVNGGKFPASQTVDFIGNTSHQDYAMISTNTSLYWLYINDYTKRYPDIVPSNPGDNFRYHPIHSHRAYATRGNLLLATSMLAGSLFFVIASFSALPILFRPNYPAEYDLYDDAKEPFQRVYDYVK